MINSEKLKKRKLIKLGQELGKIVHHCLPAAPGEDALEQHYTLGNNYFPVWSIPAVFLHGNPLQILKKAKNTGRWYHPIVKEQKITAFSVCTYRRFSGKWKLHHLEGPEIAAELEHAVELVKSLPEHNTYLIRLLEIPRFYLLALWIVASVDKIILVEFPASLRAIHYQTVYAAADFFTRLL